MANLVQYNNGTVTSSTSITLSYNNNVQAGDVLIAIVSTMGTLNHVRSITDSLNLTWYKVSQSNGFNDIEVWYAITNVSQPETVTVNMADTGDINAIIIEIAGLNTSNLIAGQWTTSGSTNTATISMSETLNNVFVLTTINTVIPSSASPSTLQTPALAPLSPFIEIVEQSLPSDNETTEAEYISNASNISEEGFTNSNLLQLEYDMITVAFNLPTTTISTSPCASLPFPLNDICYGINSISSSIVNTGQGIMGGLGYFAQSFYQALTGLANTIYNGITSIATNFYNAITNFASSIEKAFYSFGQWIYNGLNYIYTGLNQLGGWLYAVFEDFVKTLISFFNWIWQGLVNVFNTIYTAFTSGIDTLFGSFESGIVSMQNTLVSKLSQSVAVAIIMPSEFELSKAFISGISELNKKKILGSLGGMFIIPLIAGFIGDLLQGIISPQAISKLFPRPSLPSIAIPTQTLGITPTQTPPMTGGVLTGTTPTTGVTGTSFMATVGSGVSLTASSSSTKVSANAGSSASLTASQTSSVST